MGNYREISDARITEWLKPEGKMFSEDRYFREMPHAHNIFINTLAERGTFGMCALMLLLGCWGWGLAKFFVKDNLPTEQFLFWGASFSSWLTTTVIGLVNTTLHHEHALLSIVLLAGWLSWQNISPRNLAACRA